MKIKKKFFKIKLHIIAKEFFQYSLGTYLIALIIESVKEGLVSYFFNLNILLCMALLSGVLMMMTHDKKIPSLAFLRKKNIFIDSGYSLLLALGGGLFVNAYTFTLGLASLIATCLAFFLIFIISLVLLRKTDNEKKQSSSNIPSE